MCCTMLPRVSPTQARLNAQSLRRQKQRFQQALVFDSVNLDLPDIKVSAVNASGGGDRWSAG